MLTAEQKDKLNLFIGLKKNPALTLVKIVSDIKKEMLDFLQNEIKSIRNEMDTKFEKMKEISAPNMGVIEKIVNSILRDAKGDKGEPGNDGFVPLKGRDYFDGYTPLKGKDYFDGHDGYTPQEGIDYPGREEVFKEIQKVVSNIKLPQPEKGKTPVKGIDYFTKKDILDIANEVKQALKGQLEGFKNDLKDIKAELSLLKKQDMLRGGRTIHRGGITIVHDDFSTLLNGVLTDFTLTYNPRTGTEQVFINGMRGRKTTDYNLTGKILSIITAPPTLANGGSLLIEYEKN